MVAGDESWSETRSDSVSVNICGFNAIYCQVFIKAVIFRASSATYPTIAPDYRPSLLMLTRPSGRDRELQHSSDRGLG